MLRVWLGMVRDLCPIAFHCVAAHHLWTHLAVDGHLGSFQFGAIVNRGAENILE